MKNRILAMLLTFAMLLAMAPTVLADSQQAGTGSSPFADVQDSSQYYYTPVVWAVDQNITAGTSATTFSPDESCTRAQAVAMIWRAAGEPAAAAVSTDFTDVDPDAYYYDALLWGLENGIVAGTSATTFEPDATVTREDFVTFLYRYAREPELSNALTPYSDVTTRMYYTLSVAWGYQKGIVCGVEAHVFGISETCTRAQVVTFLWRYLGETDDVTILYTNDVHTYIDNHTTGSDGTRTELLSYANIAAMKKNLEAEGSNVLLVDDGDHAQGTAFGAVDQAKSIMQLMNATGYDLATLGNHEFDYGQQRLFALMDEADFPYISCNFYRVADDSLVLPAYMILETGGYKVAFIGITTPETYTAAPKSYFADDDGNQIYGIYGVDAAQDLYDSVQRAIDAIGDQADYIVGLGHLGVGDDGKGWTSIDVIEHTSGLDAFIDGHSHTTLPQQEVKDADGELVPLTQTGCYLNAIGMMHIRDGRISTELVTDYADRDADVQTQVTNWVNRVNETLGDQIAVADQTFTTMDPTTGKRIIRYRETNLGDMMADSVYWYFNEQEKLQCDCAIINGGGVRADLPEGSVTYLSSKTIQPFGNVECMIKMKGSTLREMLEYSTRFLGQTNSDGSPVESGGYLHVAGIRYSVDTSISCTVQTAADGSWAGSPTGAYRVSDIQIYNRETGTYEPIDPDRDYTVAGINYILRNGGNGYTMFADSELVLDYVGEDYLIAAYYLEAFSEGEDNWPHLCTANSPLAAYSGYDLDYENPYGAGRVTVN